eukprot:PhF_6_TR43590/c0_g1_i1/m.66950
MNSWSNFYVNQCQIQNVETNSSLLSFFHEQLDVQDHRPSVVDLTSNYLGLKGFHAFVHVMDTYSMFLQTLILRDCQLEPEAVIFLARSEVARNTHGHSVLSKVDLSFNSVCAFGASAWMETFVANTRLRDVNLDDAGVPKFMLLKFKRLMETRSHKIASKEQMTTLSDWETPKLEEDSQLTHAEVSDVDEQSGAQTNLEPWPELVLSYVGSLYQPCQYPRSDKRRRMYVIDTLEHMSQVGAVVETTLFGHQFRRCREALDSGDWPSALILFHHIRKTMASSRAHAFTSGSSAFQGVADFLRNSFVQHRYSTFWYHKLLYAKQEGKLKEAGMWVLSDMAALTGQIVPKLLLAYLMYLVESWGRDLLWVPPAAVYEHVRAPGSASLETKGERFGELMLLLGSRDDEVVLENVIEDCGLWYTMKHVMNPDAQKV